MELPIDWAIMAINAMSDLNSTDDNRVNTNEIVERQGDEAPRNRGSWRLLLDQNNVSKEICPPNMFHCMTLLPVHSKKPLGACIVHMYTIILTLYCIPYHLTTFIIIYLVQRAQWSPLHLVCVHGGIAHGKIPIMKSLLQLNQTAITQVEAKQRTQYQQQIIKLLDRQHRNVLHHLLDSVVPSNETFEAIEFIAGLVPPLLFQEDVRGKTPLLYTLERIMENPGTRRRHYMNSYGNDNEGVMKNYKMLTLLVRCMARLTRGQVGTGRVTGVTSTGGGEASLGENNSTLDSTKTTPANNSDGKRNVLHLACLLLRTVCPPDGSLITYLTSLEACKLEAKARAEADNSSSSSTTIRRRYKWQPRITPILIQQILLFM